jgi:hypothetical protein
MSAAKIVFLTMLFITTAFALDWIVTGENFFLYQYFAPKQENVRRKVYEGTKSYHQGSIQRLDTLCNQVAEADDDHKPMLNDSIKQEFAEWDEEDVPTYLQGCLSTARGK